MDVKIAGGGVALTTEPIEPTACRPLSDEMPKRMRVHQRILQGLTDALRESFYRNSLFIMLTSIVSAGASFAFWIVAARLYTAEDVGVATVLISLLGLCVLLSRMGLDQSMIRYLPGGDKSTIFSTVAIIGSVLALLLGAAVYLIAVMTHPSLDASLAYAACFLAFLLAGSIVYSAGVAYVAVRKGECYLLQNLAGSSKVVLLFSLGAWGAMGIFCSMGLSSIIALLLSVFILKKLGFSLRRVDFVYLRDSVRFSAATYVNGIFIASPGLIMPIVILGMLGAEDAARFFICYSIVSLLLVIPGSFSMSMFVEGSHGARLKGSILKTASSLCALFIPAVAILYLLSDFVLGVIGEEYAGAGALLRLMSLSSLFVCVTSICFSVKKIQKDTRVLVYLGGYIFVVLMVCSYFFISHVGLTGVGYAWLVAYSSASVIGVSTCKIGALFRDN